MNLVNQLIFFLLHLLYASAENYGLRVSTQQGDVIGTFSAPSVRQFLGIPYASAKRWQAPSLPPKRNQVLNASAFGDSCPQRLTPADVEFNKLAWTFGRTDGIFVPMSEDCLTVNIWSPSVNRKQKTAVMIWVHGGAFNWGTSRLPIYDGTSLVRDNDDVSIVSFNYRLNIFGFPNAPQFDIPGKPQNFGYLDLRAAVQWVYDNIASFGGDPERITLFGQSAGSVMVDAYAFSYPNDPMVKGLIEQSGNILSSLSANSIFDPPALPRINYTMWNTLAAAVGCGDTPTASQFSCMQRVPTKRLNDAVIKTNVRFQPVEDQVTNFRDSRARAAAGNFLKVPFLVGNTKDEWDVFTVAEELVSVGHVTPVLYELISDIVTTLTYTCGIKNSTAAHLSGGAQMFRYQYQGIFPDLSPQPDLQRRAFHGSEIPIIFGTYNQSPFAPTSAEIAFSKFMQSVWVGFARDPKQGLINLGWPEYNPKTASLAQLGNPANKTGSVLTKPDAIEGLCSNSTILRDILAGLLSFPGGT